MSAIQPLRGQTPRGQDVFELGLEINEKRLAHANHKLDELSDMLTLEQKIYWSSVKKDAEIRVRAYQKRKFVFELFSI